MIIICRKCKTKFSLGEELIKKLGSKVKCSRCGHIFTTYRTVMAEEPESGAEMEEKISDQSTDLVQVAASFAEDDEGRTTAAGVSEEDIQELLDFSLFNSELDSGLFDSEEQRAEEEISAAGLRLEEGLAAEQSAMATEEVTEKPVEEKISVADIGFEEEIGAEELELPEEEFASEEELAEEVGIGGQGFEEEALAEEARTSTEQVAEQGKTGAVAGISLEDIGLEEGFAAEKLTMATEEVTEKPVEEETTLAGIGFEEEIAAEELEASEEEFADEEAFGGPDLEEPVLPPVGDKEPRETRSISIPFLAVLIVILVGGGAYAAYRVLETFDIKVPFLESLTGTQKSEKLDPGNMRIACLDEFMTGDFVDNNKIGRLFVIKGKIRNDYRESRNFIRVRGSLHSEDGKLAQSRIVYCGNVLSDAELQMLDAASINKKLGNRFGDGKSNFKMPSGKELPFMVVFSNLPRELREYSVEVVDSVASF